MKTIAKFDGSKHRFLSNFWKSEVEYEGVKYKTSEHAYQAAKTLDPSERQSIANLDRAGEAKRAGRKVTLRDNWEGIKDGIMLDILRIKFADPTLRDELLRTGDALLVEGNTWHDNHFGVCCCDKCNGVGDNMLGELLMKVREEIKNSVKANQNAITSLEIPEIDG